MCQGNPILRILGFTFLLIAILASGIGLFAPFWIRNKKADPFGSFKTAVGKAADDTLDSLKEAFTGKDKEKHSDGALPSTTTIHTPMKNQKLTTTTVWEMEVDNDNLDNFNIKKKKRQTGRESTLANIGGVIIPTPINPLADLQSTSATKYDDKWFWEDTNMILWRFSLDGK
ncbi:hypothetical protein HELRODRAFT_160882 [Helobdella robusta]|uniref:Uncharacterized protein n=1 Tax=Helobdella robusta TaxID=6412 RepID=T1EQU1_HELRO|nr:hypothetical protein HELRODRAFT_160882 [Helobdella robusta]ESO06687.1 hypothetical protein HELRODRAFT_160882 [Helobdella robusta]